MEETFVGIDPGPTYTGVIIIRGKKILLSTTLERKTHTPPVQWAVEVTQKIVKILTPTYNDAKIGIEGVVEPKPYLHNKKNLINPKNIINLGIVVGALANQYPQAVIVRPGGNGSNLHYPEELKGKRPPNLPGNVVGTRNHERSAYDVALQVRQLLLENYTLDGKKNFFNP